MELLHFGWFLLVSSSSRKLPSSSNASTFLFEPLGVTWTFLSIATIGASIIIFKGDGGGCEPWLGLPTGARFGDDTSPSLCCLITYWKFGANQWTLPTLGLTWFCRRCGVENLRLVSKKVYDRFAIESQITSSQI